MGNCFCCSASRVLVSKKKKRYVESRTKENADSCPEGGVNLDLIIFNGNMVCMGFPASGLEAWYRNPYPDVLAFLDAKFQPGGYKVYNLCVEDQHQYDTSAYFHGNCAVFPFRDHHPCPLAMIPEFIDDATTFLNGGDEHQKRVVAIHCKAGKGRTGLMAICLLMATNLIYSDPESACDFYGAERTHNNRGLTHRSQIRYVHYYAKLRAHSDGKVPALIPVIKLKRVTLQNLLVEISSFTHISIEVLVPTAAEAKLLQPDYVEPSEGSAARMFSDRHGHMITKNIYRDGSADGVDDGCGAAVGIGEDKDSIVFDFQQVLAVAEKQQGSSIQEACSLGHILAQMRGDVRINIHSGSKVIGAVSFHTLFVQREYPWTELDKLYKAKNLKDGAGIVLDYDECRGAF